MPTPLLDAVVVEYLLQFEAHGGAGLFVVQDSEQLDPVSVALSNNDILESRSWWSAMQHISSRETTYIILDAHLSDEILDIVKQVSRNKKIITVRDKLTHEVQLAALSSTMPLLILLASERCVSNLSKEFSLKENISFVRMISEEP